jgi:hypothetical protein
VGKNFFVLIFILLIYSFQIDYCSTHQTFWMCNDFGCDVAKNPNNLSKKAATFWKADPRQGSFCLKLLH